ncbi:hypothetical protein KSS94_11445 [Pseudomonas fakonensis]|uniref:Uncharacterized protein n=1 Tax=Pseudomonas fakonensis TaxID=2842355 RepID=A0ABX8NBF9_9PSED|nr:hypothetical protein [Pseudomonas fakonensis]QXH53686.1 hypothetical protein KSS94_11445 [Pseudomonas fakonensis]
MTITMNLEVEVGVSLEEIASVLLGMNAKFVLEASSLTGNFKESNCYFLFWYQTPPCDISAEGVDKEFKVGLEGVFNSRISSLAESWSDMKIFLEGLAEKIKLRFFLSFQYESLYAAGDGSCVRFLKNMVD